MSRLENMSSSSTDSVVDWLDILLLPNTDLETLRAHFYRVMRVTCSRFRQFVLALSRKCLAVAASLHHGPAQLVAQFSKKLCFSSPG